MKVDQYLDSERASWSFGGNTPAYFDDHVKKSIPFYEEGHDLVCYLSEFFCKDDSVCYELGTATGQLVGKLAKHNAHKSDIRWVGIDTEEGMIAEAKETCADSKNVELICDNILLHDFEKTDLIVSYYTLQFLAEKHRQEMIDKIYNSLNWGGAFILFEKVRAPDARFQDIASSVYRDFKLRNNFSAEEIINKDQSLKGVLSPFSTKGNCDLLSRSGFADYFSVFKYVCFEGFLAIR